MKTSEILEFWKNAVPEGWENTCDGIWYQVEKDIRRCAFYTQACRELGLNKSILVLGHCESERIGMDLLGRWMAERTGVECCYFHTADTYEIL